MQPMFQVKRGLLKRLYIVHTVAIIGSTVSDYEIKFNYLLIILKGEVIMPRALAHFK